MAKIRLLKRLWRYDTGTEKDFGAEKNAFAIGKGYAEEVSTKKRKPKKTPKNKAIEKPTENKDFIGHVNFS